MKKILSALLVFSMLLSLMVLPAPAEVTGSDSGFTGEKVYFYSDFSSPSDIGSLVENTATNIVPEIKTSTDGKSVLSFTRGNTVTGYQYAAFNVVGTTAVENAPELVVEYMARIASVGTSTYFATTGKYPTASLRNKNVYYNQYKYEAGELLKSFDSNDWIKVTTVYSNKAATRDVYINDEFIKTITTEDDNNKNIASANPYFTGGCKSFYIPFGFYGAQGNSAELDYLKVYAKSESFMAKIKNSESTSVFDVEVEFNSTLKDADINPDNFKFTDGTNTIAASDVVKTGNNTYKVIPETPLGTGKEYTLSISVNTDVFGTALSTKALTFKTSSEVEFVDGEELYYNTFDSELGFSRVIEVANEIVYGLDTTKEGLSIFKAQGTDVYQDNANYGFFSPVISAANGPEELVLEYKIRVHADNPESYMGTWKGNERSKAVDFACGEDTKDRLYFHYSDKEPIPGDYTFNPKEWNTITIVYPKNRQSRDIYVNGEFIATSPEGIQENTYASAGKTTFAMLPDFRCSDDLLEVDYYKFTNKTTLFDASLINADSGSVFVKFNTTPANISPEAFALSDGTAISEIKAVDERTYMLVPETDLNAGSYTLSFNGLKDTLGRAIERESLSFEIASDPSDERVILNYQFEENADKEIQEIKAATIARRKWSVTDYQYINAEDGKLVFTGKGDGGNATYMTIPKYITSETVRPDFILEYKINMTASSDSNYLTSDALVDAGDSNTIDFNRKGIAWTRADQTAATPNLLMTNAELGGYNNWHTIALKYSSKNEVRTLYVDGVEIATSPDKDTLADNYWAQKSYIYFTFKNYTHKSTTDNVKFEYIRTYYAADKLTAEIKEVSEDLKTVYIDFNTTVADITPEMINVGGQTPASVTVYDEEEQVYALNLANKLKAGTDYTVSVMGAKSALAKECYEVLDFTTRAAEEINITASVNNASAGSVVINGVEGTSATALENTDVVLTVKPYINYKATVKVNDEALFVDRFDKYTIRNITEDTTVSVEFTEVTEAEAAAEAIETILNPYVDKISVYAFGVLKRNSDDYGVIVSNSKNNLTFEAVAAGTAQKFKADGVNAFGEYGVRLIDVGKKLGKTVYVIPYAVYGDQVVYGTVLGATR